MGNIYFSGLLRNSILCTTTVAFLSGSVCTSILAAWQPEPHYIGDVNFNLNDIAFIARLEKLYDRAKRYKDKLESGKLTEVMFEIKTEVEGYTGKKSILRLTLTLSRKKPRSKGLNSDLAKLSRLRKT